MKEFIIKTKKRYVAYIAERRLSKTDNSTYEYEVKNRCFDDETYIPVLEANGYTVIDTYTTN